VSTARATAWPCAPAAAEVAAMWFERGWDERSPDIAASILRVRLRRDGGERAGLFLVSASASSR
jgi:hypothetical protein